MKELLNNNKTGLRLFEDPITVDTSLPKWVNAQKREKKEEKTGYFTTLNSETTSGERFGTNQNSIPTNIFITVNGNTNDSMDGLEASSVKFDDVAALGLQDLNAFINENKYGLFSCLGLTGRYSNSYSVEGQSVPFLTEYPKPNAKGLRRFIQKAKILFKKEDKYELDAIQFFTAIKASSLESAHGYVDRVSKYLKAIHRASSIGQTALVAKLAREMVGNRYESFLAAEGYYYVVTEEDVVKFAKKTEKGVAIDYIKNFVRPIPEAVVEKIIAANKLEVFDNYVIMHYDPEGKSYMETPKEEIKRRDPIVFGVIAGSNKLYYITDWIDDYCDLTLAKFVDTLKITKEDLIRDETEKEKVEEQRKADAAEKKATEAKKDNKKSTAKKEVKKNESKKTKKTNKK